MFAKPCLCIRLYVVTRLFWCLHTSLCGDLMNRNKTVFEESQKKGELRFDLQTALKVRQYGTCCQVNIQKLSYNYPREWCFTYTGRKSQKSRSLSFPLHHFQPVYVEHHSLFPSPGHWQISFFYIATRFSTLYLVFLSFYIHACSRGTFKS